MVLPSVLLKAGPHFYRPLIFNLEMAVHSLFMKDYFKEGASEGIQQSLGGL